MKSSRPFSIDALRAHVGNCSDAGIVFERLGFRVTPRSQLPGLSNRLVCFQPYDLRGASFLELLSIDDRATASPAALNLLGEQFGPVAVVLSSEDALGLSRLLNDERIELKHIQRKWQLSQEVLDVELSTLNIPKAVSPLGWAVVEHRTPQHYRIPQFVEHPNGMKHLKAVICVAPEPDELIEHFGSRWAGTVLKTEWDTRLQVGKSELRIYAPNRLRDVFGISSSGNQPEVVGAVLTFTSLDALKGHLEPAGLAQSKQPQLWHLPQSAACGCLLVFSPNHSAEN